MKYIRWFISLLITLGLTVFISQWLNGGLICVLTIGGFSLAGHSIADFVVNRFTKTEAAYWQQVDNRWWFIPVGIGIVLGTIFQL